MPGIHQIGGIIPVLFSFFDERGAIKLDAFDRQIDYCLENGATGIVLFGFVTQFYRRLCHINEFYFPILLLT